MLLEIKLIEYYGTAITVMITIVIGWIGNLMVSTFKKINDTAETKAKVDAHKIEFDKHVTEMKDHIKDLQHQINDKL